MAALAGIESATLAGKVTAEEMAEMRQDTRSAFLRSGATATEADSLADRLASATQEFADAFENVNQTAKNLIDAMRQVDQMAGRIARRQARKSRT